MISTTTYNNIKDTRTKNRFSCMFCIVNKSTIDLYTHTWCSERVKKSHFWSFYTCRSRKNKQKNKKTHSSSNTKPKSKALMTFGQNSLSLCVCVHLVYGVIVRTALASCTMCCSVGINGTAKPPRTIHTASKWPLESPRCSALWLRRARAFQNHQRRVTRTLISRHFNMFQPK